MCVEQGLASVEKHIEVRESYLNETVGEMSDKLGNLKLSQKRDEELTKVKEWINMAKMTQPILHDNEKTFELSLHASLFCQIMQTTEGFPPQETQSKLSKQADGEEDELWNSFERNNQLAQESK